MEVSSFPAPAEATATKVPEKVETDWEVIKARAHKLLGCSSYKSNRTIQPHVLEEHSSSNPVSNGETGIDIQSTNGRNKENLLKLGHLSQTMVIEQGGGNAQKQISNLFCNSQMKGNCSDDLVNTKGTTISSSSSHQGDAKRIFLGNFKEEKAETNMRTGSGGSSQKKRTDSLKTGSSKCATATAGRGLNHNVEDEEDEEDSSGCDNMRTGGSSQKKRTDSQKIGSSQRATASAGRGLNHKVEDEENEEDSSSCSIEKKIKTRSLTSIYADIRSQMPSS
ncbi:putative phosphatidylinositol glycan [Corchorus olitorius]|uniref:Phosphatidylinositol glycan n=1 Tax=Corchorus olitorius TaxID=93759 RepID=A0A1R3K8Q2_9ROSI|nr:putative phosphatidylinositol glycan [Corchorus olitorius]